MPSNRLLIREYFDLLREGVEAFGLKEYHRRMGRLYGYTEGLKEDRAHGKCYVFMGGSNDTIFHDGLGCHVVFSYRAWHDSMHLKHNLDFSYESELKLASILYDEALAIGISEDGANLIRLDLSLHIQHYYKHNKHPEDQVTMINHALLYGIPKTLEKVW